MWRRIAGSRGGWVAQFYRWKKRLCQAESGAFVEVKRAAAEREPGAERGTGISGARIEVRLKNERSHPTIAVPAADPHQRTAHMVARPVETPSSTSSPPVRQAPPRHRTCGSHTAYGTSTGMRQQRTCGRRIARLCKKLCNRRKRHGKRHGEIRKLLKEWLLR